MSSLLSGKSGTFKEGGTALDVDVVGWDFEETPNTQKFASDKTSGCKYEYVTVTDWTAKVRVKIPSTGTLPFNPGDTFAMELHGDDSGNNYVKANGIVIGGAVPCDITEGQNSEVEYSIGPRGPAIKYGVYWAGAGSSGI